MTCPFHLNKWWLGRYFRESFKGLLQVGSTTTMCMFARCSRGMADWAVFNTGHTSDYLEDKHASEELN